MTERSLAHIEKIINVHPIPKADRIVMAEVLGWQCVVGKDAKPGDLVVYIEIDSLVPDIPVFKFMESRHFKVRTARFMKQISQGLAMPLDAEMIAALGGKTNWKEGDDVTDLLKITKYDPEVTDPVGDEPPLRRRRGRITSWFMQFAWFRWVYLKLFGPDPKGTFPSFIPKTDETRIQNYTRLFEQFPIERTYVSEKLDGCVSGRMTVATEDGYQRISTIVTNQLDVRVVSYNPETKTTELKKILDYHKIPATRPVYKIGVGMRGKGNRPKFVECTDNHEFFTGKEWKRADELQVGDPIWHRGEKVPYEMRQLILGSLLGDASITGNKQEGTGYNSIFFSQGADQSDYFEYKKQLLGGLFIEQSGTTGGFPGSKPNRRGILASNLDIYTMVREICLVDGKKTVTQKWADMLGPIALAFWYMDDGSICNREKDNSNCRAVFNTQGFSYEENLILLSALKRLGIDATLGDPETYGGYIIRLDVENTEKMASMVAPYICHSLKYKLPKKYETLPSIYENSTFDIYNSILPTQVLSVEKLDPKAFGHHVYDLTVEGNHNYFVNGILVHNCSATYYVLPRKGFFGKKWTYGVASRNLSVAPDGNTNWARVGRMLDLEKKLIQLAESIYPQGVAIQGEIVGPGIQGNIYQRPDLEMYIFNIYDLGKGERIGFGEMVGACKSVGLKTVPILNAFFTLDHTLADLLEYAEGKTVMDMPQPCEREGVVIRTHDQKISFKVVSNTYLLGKTKKEETEEKAAATAEKPSEEQTPKSPS